MFNLGGYEMKKIAPLFLTLSVVCCLLFALSLNASAASTGAVEGLEVSLQTDKDTYAENEEIIQRLALTPQANLNALTRFVTCKNTRLGI